MSDNKGKGRQIDFIVTTSNPKDAVANKKRVRSVAALKSWPERRKKLFEQLAISGSGQGAFLVNAPQPKRKAPPGGHRTPRDAIAPSAGRPVAGPSLPELPRATYLGGDLGPSIALYHPTLANIPTTEAAVAPVQTADSEVACQCQQCWHDRNLADAALGAARSDQYAVIARKKRMVDGSEKETPFRGDVSMPTPPTSPGPSPSRGKTDPFNCYPVPYQPWFDHILHHMMTVYAPRGWPALKITENQGLKWEWFMTQNALSEPALFYVRLLFGSGDMIKLGTLRSGLMYWLRAQAIKCINEALDDPKRCCSDAIILAVGRIALHEHMYGDKYASTHVHRPAQKRMIEMRGGMHGLETFPDLVKRLMRWSDRIMAVGSGTERLLEDEDANPNFSLRESVDAIERWAPHEMPGVRSKIKISDLVNDDGE